VRFIALYDGPTVSSAQLLALTGDERIVKDFGRRLFEDDLPNEPLRNRNAATPTRGKPRRGEASN